MVIRFAMPKNGLRFTGPPRTDGKSASGEPGRYSSYASIRKADTVPTGLFRTNHYLSSVSLDIFTREACMHIGVSARAMISFDQRVKTYGLPGRVPANNVRCFTSMQRYQLNIRPGNSEMTNFATARRYSVEKEGYEFLHYELKEQLRLTSDMLAGNDNILHLKVTFPCYCSLPPVRDASRVAPAILDFLTPLKRIKVATTVLFIPAHGLNVQAEDDLCNKPECLNLAQTIQVSMGQLSGEVLNHREATWKRVKAMERPTGPWATLREEFLYNLRQYWLASGASKIDESFEFWTEIYVPALEDIIEQWNLKKAASRAEIATKPKKTLPKSE
ncbi:MAG: hypothetical protein Q9221_001244 [Calogaya cf. arnoldii]